MSNLSSLRAAIAANERWARVTDRTAATSAARAALEARFEREADPEGKLSPTERARRVKNVRSAFYARIRLERAKKASKRNARSLPSKATARESGVSGAKSTA